jgi:ABC-type antimicrobial peptide transport system permease subunit
VISIQTYKRFHEEGLVLWFIKTAARLFAVFGALALFLAVIGIYGVKSYIVARRTREIGIRMALGADARKVLWMVLREGLFLTGLGLAVGLALSVIVGLGLRGMIYGVQAIDPLAFTLAPLFLALAAVGACYLPARRATKVQPMAALRYE